MVKDLTRLVKEHGSLVDVVDYMEKNVEPKERGEILTHGLAHYANNVAAITLLSTYIGYAFDEVAHERDEAVELRDMDDLTDVPKRITLKKDFDNAYSRLKRDDIPFSIMIADIDKFKLVNDNYGHLAGDSVLKEFAGRLTETVRDIDSVYRYGGEEFAVIYSGADAENAVNAANHLRKSIASSGFDIGEEDFLKVTFSGGIYGVKEGDTLTAAIGRADEALYEAKDNGRDRIVLYDKD